MNELTAIADPGTSPVARLFRDGLAAGSVPMNESSQAGFYTAGVPAALPAGTYQVLVVVGQQIVGSGELDWSGSEEVRVLGVDGKVSDLHLVHGLDPQSPLEVTTTSRNAGLLHQTITDNAGTVVVQRV